MKPTLPLDQESRLFPRIGRIMCVRVCVCVCVFFCVCVCACVMYTMKHMILKLQGTEKEVYRWPSNRMNLTRGKTPRSKKNSKAWPQINLKFRIEPTFEKLCLFFE